MTNYKRINPQRLIPAYWGIRITEEEDLLYLGSKNLECLKQYWRKEEREIVGQIKTVQAQIDMLDCTVDELKMKAAEYEHPEFPKIGVPKDSWSKFPEPLDEASANRESNTTTFNVCGWCEFCDGGLWRHNYCITTSCELIPEEMKGKKGCFNTPCALTHGTQEFLDTCVAYLKSKISLLVAKKNEISENVRFIVNLMKQAEEKPCFAEYRSANYFELEDEVVCYIPNNFENAIREGVFVAGRVIDGYRHGNGCVSVCAHEKVHTGDYCEGHGLGYSLSSSCVMHKWEYEYLKAHPDYLEVWIKVSANRFDSNELAKAFSR